MDILKIEFFKKSYGLFVDEHNKNVSNYKNAWYKEVVENRKMVKIYITDYFGNIKAEKIIHK